MKTILAFALGLLALPLSAQQSQSIERSGDGMPVCGLGKDFHAGRRALLMERVGEEVMVFRGMSGVRENAAFRQDKTFWYLTGVESENAALVLDGKAKRSILFLPERTGQLRMMEGWEGEKWDASDEWVGALTGFEEIRPSGELLDVLETLLDDRDRIGVSLHPPIVLAGSYDAAGAAQARQRRDPLDGRMSRSEALAMHLEEKLGVETFDVAAAINEMRRVKAPEEIAAMKRAARAGSLAMTEAIRSTRPGIGEWDLDALMRFIQIRAGAAGPAYAAIVGAGVNACVLHYTANSKRIEDGEVVLIDFGPEVDHYTTDITRSWPSNGEFSERQLEIYAAVLAAQEAGIAAAKPGVTMGEISRICAGVLAEHGFGREWIRHGACHYIGMAVHDPGDSSKPVEPGVAFTIEPGLYDAENGIGVRIEDVVVITEDGCEVISTTPKGIDEIEALVRERGLLDAIDGHGD